MAHHTTDVHVGNRVRELRIRKGLSQQALGEQVGVSFQQIQKYERGTNRMGSSRLVQIADVLDEDLAVFFQGIGRHGTRDARDMASGPGEDLKPLDVRASKVARYWTKLGDSRLQDQTATMLRSLARAAQNPGPTSGGAPLSPAE